VKEEIENVINEIKEEVSIKYDSIENSIENIE
jgi:hypothetical protein